jgi:uncharacterized protein YndB with AHSA1/START domain
VAWMGTRAELDPRPGGRYRVEVESGGVAAGEYREVDPPHRLVFSWGWEGDEALPAGSTTVEITLAPAGSGCLLRLRHLGLPSPEQRELHQGGWHLYADRLAGLFG